MKRLFVILCAVFFVMVLNGQTNERERIVILNMKALQVEVGLADTVTEVLIASFVNFKKYQVVERSQLDKIFGELRLTSSDEFTDSVVLDIGRLSKSRMIIIGSVGRAGSTYVLTIRAIEVETGNILFAETKSVKGEDGLISAAEMIVEKLHAEEKAAIEKEKQAKLAEEQKKVLERQREAEAERLRLIEEQKQREIDAEAEGVRLLEEEAQLKIEAKQQYYRERPLLKGGGAMLAFGIIGLAAGGVLLGVDMGYLMTEADNARNYATGAAKDQLSYSEYEDALSVYNKKFDTHIGVFAGSVVTLSFGVLMIAGSVPMLIYKKKDANVSFNVSGGNGLTFAVNYSF